MHFKPKLFTIKADYSKEQFLADLMASIIVTVLGISLSIAFAISMGVSPEIGLYVSVIGSFVIALLGGTYVNVGGPSAVFIVTIAGLMATHGIQGVMISTFMAGIILVIAGVLKLGTMVKYLPYPIVVGFMSGIAVVIFTTQIRGFFGLYDLQNVPSNFFLRWGTYLSALGDSSLTTVLVGLLGLAILIFWPKVTKKVPGGLIVLIVTTFIVTVFNLDTQTIGSQFQELTLSLPQIELTGINISLILTFLPSAFTIAFLCTVSALVTAVAADTIIGKKHDPNTELVAQGISNILLGMWGMIPSTGVPTRTIANVESGARTPVSTLIHSILMLLFIIFALPLLRLIPMVTLAVMLMVAAHSMFSWHSFRQLANGPRSDVVVMLITFGLTILVDLPVAVIVGISMAILFHIKDLRKVLKVEPDISLNEEFPDLVRIYHVTGTLFFGDSTEFMNAIRLKKTTKVLLLCLREVPDMDATALQTLTIILDKCRQNDTRLVLTEIPKTSFQHMKRMDLNKLFGKDNLFLYYQLAVQDIANMLRDKNVKK